MTPEQQKSLHQAFSEFIGAFEVVFHYDWEYTASMLDGGDEAPSLLLPVAGLDEDAQDWGALAAMLERYRNVVAAMKAAGLSPSFPFPLENLPGSAERLW